MRMTDEQTQSALTDAEIDVYLGSRGAGRAHLSTATVAVNLALLLRDMALSAPDATAGETKDALLAEADGLLQGGRTPLSHAPSRAKETHCSSLPGRSFRIKTLLKMSLLPLKSDEHARYIVPWGALPTCGPLEKAGQIRFVVNLRIFRKDGTLVRLGAKESGGRNDKLGFALRV
eukprot:2882469-Pleurochrysis_carterae.AAC.3